jgi:carnitine 3-dehydrogenase
MPSDEHLSRFGDPAEVRTVGVVGTGSVGSSWLTFALARGLEVLALDPQPDSPAAVRAFVEAAWPSMIDLGLTNFTAPPFGSLQFVKTTTDLAAAELIFEAVPERKETKRSVLCEIAANTPPSTIISTSTGGMDVSSLQEGCVHPERIVLLHPLNPAYLIPLVEVCGGAQTDPAAVEWVVSFCRRHGKVPVVLRREAVGHLTNRLQSALLREAVYCLLEGIASADDIDLAVTSGLGARWSAVGPFKSAHLAGGRGGAAAILAHAGDAMSAWWDSLGEIKLTHEVRERLILESKELERTASFDDLVGDRDAHLVRLFRQTSPAPAKDA